MKVKNSLILILALSLSLVTFFPRPCAGSINFDVNSDAEMDLRYDWVINVKVNDSNYLSYPGSTLKPLTQLQISYRLNPRFIADIPTAGKYIEYEELWYHSNQVVGSRRLHDLILPAEFQGAIRFLPTASVLKNDAAIAGASVRLLLDVVLHNCKLSIIYVPVVVLDQVIADLAHFNFYTAMQNEGLQVITLPLASNPIGTMQTLYRSGNP